MEANFHIITGQVTAARNLNKCVHRADLEVTELILEPLASADAVLSAEEKEAGVVLVDIGGGTTDIAIFSDHIRRFSTRRYSTFCKLGRASDSGLLHPARSGRVAQDPVR